MLHQRCFESSCHCLLASRRVCGSGQPRPSIPGSAALPAYSGTAGRAEEARGRRVRAGSNREKAMRLWCEEEKKGGNGQERTSTCFILSSRDLLPPKKERTQNQCDTETLQEFLCRNHWMYKASSKLSVSQRVRLTQSCLKPCLQQGFGIALKMLGLSKKKKKRGGLIHK